MLLCRRAIPPDRGAWSVVGGRCDPWESYRDAAAREAKEEARGDWEFMEALAAHLPEGFVFGSAPEEVQYSIPWIFGWR
ncbi:MAG: hypothetical protein RIS70_4212, partial [Planctomycetota bacterium]